MSLTTEEGVTTHQQEVITLKAQVADQTGVAEAVRAINNLAIPQVLTDAPSMIDGEGPERPKEFTGKEQTFQQWSKKTEAFFAGVIKEFKMMLEWSAGQVTAFLPLATIAERGVPKSEFVSEDGPPPPRQAASLAPRAAWWS